MRSFAKPAEPLSLDNHGHEGCGPPSPTARRLRETEHGRSPLRESQSTKQPNGQDILLTIVTTIATTPTTMRSATHATTPNTAAMTRMALVAAPVWTIAHLVPLAGEGSFATVGRSVADEQASELARASRPLRVVTKTPATPAAQGSTPPGSVRWWIHDCDGLGPSCRLGDCDAGAGSSLSGGVVSSCSAAYHCREDRIESRVAARRHTDDAPRHRSPSPKAPSPGAPSSPPISATSSRRCMSIVCVRSRQPRSASYGAL